MFYIVFTKFDPTVGTESTSLPHSIGVYDTPKTTEEGSPHQTSMDVTMYFIKNINCLLSLNIINKQ